MKKLVLFLCAGMLSAATYAQIETPAASPFQKLEQKVGLTDVTLEYSRPSKKGRDIFGGLVPYDKIWRTGANANTKISFSEDVMVNGKMLKAGSYAIYTKPGTTSWEVYFYTDSNNWGNPPEWDPNKVAAMVKSEVYKMPMAVETFTITMDDLSNDSANLGIMWDDVYVAAPINFMTDKAVTASIQRVMEGPSAGDYYNAAVYYLTADKDINKAKMWIDKAIQLSSDEPRFWYYRQQSLIHAKAGDKDGAIKAAQKSLELAKKAGNDDYVALNTKSLKEWGAM